MDGIRVRAAWAVALATAICFLGGAADAQARAQCTTFNARSEPSSTFSGGDKITVRGTGFGPDSVVLVTFLQETRSVELAKATANDLGAFSTDAQLPPAVAAGTASIRALDARGSAACPLTLTATETEEEANLTGLWVVWGALLAVFGAVLAALTYRRWKSERLRAALHELAGPATVEARDTVSPRPGAVPAVDEEEWSFSGSSRARTATAPARPLEVDADDLVEVEDASVAEPEQELRWFYPDDDADEAFEIEDEDEDGDPDESVEVHVTEPEPSWIEPEPAPEPEPEPEAEPDPEPVASPQRGGRETDYDEPPVLPVGWDRGRLRPNRQTSDAIERLRREVRTWKKT